ncbi:hypothetical protein BS47DRAFT_1352471 [Hydnum rufescens UP504]|uniref:Uncharacterized protein n=1 Tax=Hydnum rufescens UP504 TaxID=1448309 RepID=A0A9P6AJW2_9AGAM|nr:hypothetical protein BS47DRAFT_1352471 [Hydnum rufescens UP504]
MDMPINYHYHRRSPALLRAAVERRQSSVNTYGGVETYSATSHPSTIVIDSAIPSYTGPPTTQTPSVTATPTSQTTTSSSSQLLTDSPTSSSLTSPASSVVPVQSTPSASWVSSHKLILAGAIAAFIALALAIVFVVTVGCRRVRQKRLQEEISRKSFAAGQNSVLEQPRTEKSTMLSGSKGHAWRGLGSKEDIPDFGGGDPVPIVLSEYAYPKGEKHGRRQSLAPDLPQQEHEPFHLTGAFGSSPTNDDDDGLMRPTTPPHSFATLRTLTPHKSGFSESHPRTSLQSVSSIYTDRIGPEILPPSPPLPIAETGRAAKVARTNNIKALDSLIAALDHANDGKGSATGLPEPSVWRAALGGSPTSSPRPSNRHAEHGTHPRISSSRLVR